MMMILHVPLVDCVSVMPPPIIIVRYSSIGVAVCAYRGMIEVGSAEVFVARTDGFQARRMELQAAVL